jgi:hypothetical protein
MLESRTMFEFLVSVNEDPAAEAFREWQKPLPAQYAAPHSGFDLTSWAAVSTTSTGGGAVLMSWTGDIPYALDGFVSDAYAAGLKVTLAAVTRLPR